MKNLIFIMGPNGVGKSSACRALVAQKLANAAYVDSDWCRCIRSFSFTDAEKMLVTANITALLLNYMQADIIENVVFSYGLHGPRRQIWRNVLYVLDESSVSYRLCPVVLICDEQENLRRMRQDNRNNARVERALAKTRAIYDGLPYPRLDNTQLGIDETAEQIARLLAQKYAIK